MAKYRTLTTEELNTFEKEFIDFLVVNGITADDWVKIKSESIEKAEKIIDQFSDVIMEGTLRKIQYLEYISPKSIKCFQCLSKEIVLVAVDADEDSEVDFTSQKWSDDLNNLKIYSSKKDYGDIGREHEIFNMIQRGASVSNGALFKKLCLAL